MGIFPNDARYVSTLVSSIRTEKIAKNDVAGNYFHKTH